ncbi:hypothetical protein C5E10_11590 [Pseudoclavibacter sp. RFBG4]|uniref:ABC transporter ATP-binding protein/permease n=1 Tax=Pseudoclavibacter sp. RFBG4 TaxID=2080575 RepID=UPI000CE7E4EF|nr:ATP-binding cassette domain-containing protein [Pseudoclavibacter sp. RFBG4]PPG30772.1 hypothetical protein C5E10_11590 [Pseudoclavibacter sp. RFBG4]
MSVPIIELRAVGRRFDDTEALSSVDLQIFSGEFLAIVGPSGAGKSSLLNVLGLLDRPSSGVYLLDGQDVAEIPERQRDSLRGDTFGFVFQDSFVLPCESVMRNTALGLRIRGDDKATQATESAASLERLGIRRLGSKRAGELSGGERQRVAIARAIATSPRVLLADEPTGNLDSENSAAVVAYLRELSTGGTTVIVITHSHEVAAQADRTVVIRDGTITQTTDSDSAASLRDLATPPAVRPLTSSVPSGGAHRRRLLETLSDAVTSLAVAPRRSGLLLAAFVLSMGGLVAAVNIGATSSAQISQRLSAAALDEVVVLPEVSAIQSPHAELAHAAETISSLEATVGVGQRVELSGAGASTNRPLYGAPALQLDGPTIAVDASLLNLGGASVWPATALEQMDAEDGIVTAVLGADAAEELGVPIGRVGDQISVAGQEVTVVGHLRSAGRDPALSQAVLVSAADLVVPQDSTLKLVVRTLPGAPAVLSEVIPLALDTANPDSVRIETVADLRALQLGVDTDLALNLAVISGVVLVLTCLTTSVSILLSVSARTHEIALRRALGASRGQIQSLFVLEGATTGIIGGLCGVSVGLAATTLVCAMQGWTPQFVFATVWIGIAGGLLVGVVAALVPARRASRIEPAVALRAR